MTFDIRPMRSDETQAVCDLLTANGWAHRILDAKWFESLVANSSHALVAVTSNTIVGFARAICDHLSNGYISMVVVAPQYRRQGIGRALVEYLIAQDTQVTWVLRAGRDGAEEFFSQLGFAPSTQAMEFKRRSV
jgi:ribosomal protein S18 acetylase RimI-like enzyme